MNLFVLDMDTRLAAEYHCDQHVAKMAVEAAQLLSSATSVLTGNYEERPSKNGKRMLRKYLPCAGLYKPTHYNHPCCVWIRESVANGLWAWSLGLDLLAECVYRGIKAPERTREVLLNMGKYWKHYPAVPTTNFVLAINPEKYPTVKLDPENPVETYREYYKKGKAVFPTKGPATWKKRGEPAWWSAA